MRRFAPFRLFLIFAVVAVSLLATVGPAQAGSPPNRLDDNRGLLSPVSLAGDACTLLLGPFLGLFACPGIDGRVVPHPDIWNVFADDNWDTDNPNFSQATVNGFTQNLVNSNYFDNAGQYGVGSATFKGSSTNNGCFGAPSGTTNFLSILLWITCEVQLPGTGIPYPDDNTMYALYLRAGTVIDNGINKTCSTFGAYHFQSMALVVTFDLGFIPIPSFQSYPFAVIPTDCANGTVDGLTNLSSHELIEAATDPIFLHGWIDNSKFGLNIDIATEGEAADICEPGTGDAPAQPVRLDNGLKVARYWSNSLGACVPTTHHIHLDATGLPSAGTVSVTSAAITGDNNAHQESLPFNADVVDGAHVSWSFPTPVAGSPGVQYVTSDPGSGGSAVISADQSDVASYTKQDRLTVNTAPGFLSGTDGTLTPSQWVNDGATASLTTDSLIPSGVDRYRFDNWGGDLSALTTSAGILMNGPKTATANYVLQHNITFGQTGIPTSVPWVVTVDGTAQIVSNTSPATSSYNQWFDDGSFHTFVYQNPVPDLTPGTQYALTSTSTASPLQVLATGTVTGAYRTQHLLTVNTTGLPPPNLTTITNAGATLGTANDSTPMTIYLDHGTVLTLSGDADVNGAGGIQYFAQTFNPVPPAALNAPFTTTLKYETIAQIIQDILTNGGLNGPSANGQATAFNQEWNGVQASMAAHQYATVLARLGGFIGHTQSQSGKALTVAAANAFLYYASLVYHTALCLAGPQLTAAQAASDYQYYQTLALLSGHTPLPPC
jgi:hypothetical protein